MLPKPSEDKFTRVFGMKSFRDTEHETVICNQCDLILNEKKVIEINPENMFVELYAASTKETMEESSIMNWILPSTLIYVALPFILRAIRGEQMFDSDYHLAVEVLAILTKLIYFFFNLFLVNAFYIHLAKRAKMK